MTDCIFCKIVARQIPAQILKETDRLVAFRDVNPQAPTHVLVVPTKHIPTVDALEDEDAGIVGDLFLAARDLAREQGLTLEGYRLVMNTGESAGQTVFHIHLHLLAGRPFAWPPG